MKKGIIITPEDLNGYDWISMLRQLNLNTLGIHSGGGANHNVLRQLAWTAAPGFRERCADAALACEYEVHAAEALLTPELFSVRPEYFALHFRENSRSSSTNFCMTNPEVPAILEDNAEHLAKSLPSVTHRYYFWGADHAYGFCHCPECAKYTFSELNLLAMNAVAKGVRRADPFGKAACLVYVGCYEVPERVEPEENLFFEFAPYVRCYHHAVSDASCHVNRIFADSFRRYAAAFGTDRMQVLEYWLDSSLFSKYRKPAAVPFVSEEVMRRDIEFYCNAGIRDITTFAVYMDGEYFKRNGDGLLRSYAAVLNEFLPDHAERG